LPDEPMSIMRDYDSIIGLTTHIAIDTHLTLIPVSNPVDALTSNIHLRVNISKGRVSTFVVLL
jgi:uncharacterized membrane protein YczE